jgi:hypothetical protein
LTRAVGVKELAPFLPFGLGKLAEEVFVDLAEGVPLDVERNGVEGLEQGRQGIVADLLVGLGQHPFQLGIFLLDKTHRQIDLLADVLPLGEIQQIGKPRRLG